MEDGKKEKKPRGKGVPFVKGNELWKMVKNPGRNKEFETPENLWKEACRYFEWCNNSPLMGYKTLIERGKSKVTREPKLRPYTITGLCIFLEVSEGYFRSYRHANKDLDDAYSTVIALIEKTVYDQKFSAASADLLNARIISRDLGLRDAKDITSNGQSISSAPPVINQVMSEGMPAIANNENDINDKEKKK